MTKRSKLQMIQAGLLNWLMLILIILMVASVFSVLLIKGVLFKERQVNLEPHRVLATVCCALPLSGSKS